MYLKCCKTFVRAHTSAYMYEYGSPVFGIDTENRPLVNKGECYF